LVVILRVVVFNEATAPYQQAVEESGYDYKIKDIRAQKLLTNRFFKTLTAGRT